MKKALSFMISLIAVSFASADDTGMNEIIGRYNVSLDLARNVCTGISSDIDQIKLRAGIGIGTGAVGTIAGGTAAVAGIVKSKTDAEMFNRANYLANQADKEEFAAAIQSGEISSLIEQMLSEEGEGVKFQAMQQRSQTLGNVRTIGSSVAGVTGIVGASTSLQMAVFNPEILDNLVANIDACNGYIKAIETQERELIFVAPDNPAIAQMNKILSVCKGMDSKNIIEVKKRMATAGWFSAAGGVAGVVGGITSALAVGREKQDANKPNVDGAASTNGLNMAANISSGVAAAGNLGGAIFSGAVLAGLNTNDKIAKTCAEAF